MTLSLFTLAGIVFLTVISTSLAALYYRELLKHRMTAMQFHDAIDKMPQGIVLYDPEEKLQKANNEALILIPEIESFKTQDEFMDFVFENRRKQPHTEFLNFHNANYHFARHDFREIIFWHDRHCLVQARSRSCGGSAVQITDISDLKNREEELLRLYRENKELVQAIEASGTGIIINDAKKPDLPVVYANRSFCNAFNMKPDDLMNRDWVYILSSQADIQKPSQVLDSLGDRKPVTVEWQSSKSHRWYELNLSPIHDTQGDVDVFVGLLSDITDFKNHEIRHYQAQKLEALGELAGGVAHDFNNILSIIDGYARMAMKDMPENSTTYTYLDRVKQATRRGASLTKQLLTFGRHKIIGDSVVDAGKSIQEQEHLLRPLLETSVDLRIQAEENCLVDCAVDNLSQVVMNLVINARDAMPEGGAIIVDVRQCKKDEFPDTIEKDDIEGDDFVCLSVRDTGVGMDAETMHKIFDPFFTTKDQGKGTGLGLSMVYGIINQQGGHIDVQSVLGEGTVITIYLPLSDKDIAKAISVTADNAAGIRFDGYTALVAEDEPDLLQVVRSMLEDLGMEVISASNGNEALALQDEYEGDIDFLVTDVVMPELNGIKLAELMTALRPETNVLFMSGYPANTDMARVHLPENATFLAKPVEFEKLAHYLNMLQDDSIDTSSLASEGKDMNQWQSEVSEHG